MISRAIRLSQTVRILGPLRTVGRRLGVNRLLRLVYYNLLLRQGSHHTSLFGRRLYFSVSTRREIDRIDSLSGEHEFIARMVDSLRQGDVVFDVGANIGMISLLLASVKPAGNVQVHAFEPEPSNVGQLARNIELNGLAGQVHLQPIALSDHTGTASLYLRGETGSGVHSLVGDETLDHMEVPLRRMSTLADEYGTAPDVVKIDVEGAEMDVLRGMDELLQRSAIRDLFIELHPEKLLAQGIAPGEVQSWLEDRGLHPVWTQTRDSEIHQHFRREERSSGESLRCQIGQTAAVPISADK